MSDKLDLDFYGETRLNRRIAGGDYYVTKLESARTFDDDPELKAAFVAAQTGYNASTNLIDKRIIGLGGKPDDWQA